MKLEISTKKLVETSQMMSLQINENKIEYIIIVYMLIINQ